MTDDRQPRLQNGKVVDLGPPFLALMPRVWSKIVIDPTSGCWIWQGYQQLRNGESEGYASLDWNGRPWLVHRAVYSHLVGAIPEGLELDHLCERKPCCNPDHLEPVTHEVNNKRAANLASTINAKKTHCKYGHEFTPENTVLMPQSMGRPGVARCCLTCRPHLRKYAA